jgi:hypothetical protein
MTDSGTDSTVNDNSGSERPDPENDPTVCSKCGCYVGQFSDEYCDGCARDLGIKPPLRRCVECGHRAPEEQMTAIDVSLPDEYYPTFEHLCKSCSLTTDSEQGDRDV